MLPSLSIAERVARIHALLEQGRSEQVLQEISLVERNAPVEQGLCFFLTGLFFLKEDFAGRALQAMEQACRLEPSSRECLYGLAMANSALGFYQEVLFCNKIGATTREIAQERGWGEVLTPELRAMDRLLFVTDEQVILFLVERYRKRGDFLRAARVAEDALLAFAQNLDWRRAAIVNYRSANRPFAAASLLQAFAARSAMSVEDQALTGELFADLGAWKDSLSWLERIVSLDKTHRNARAGLARLLFCSKLSCCSQRVRAVEQRIVSGLPKPPRRRGSKPRIEERLRIGIVSSDLLVGGLVERVALLFEMFDKSNIEFFLYIDSPHQDSLTERFKSLSKDHFHTFGIDDATFARIVSDDEIDILLDLDLRRIYCRPAVARLKPAALHVAAFADPAQAYRWGFDAVLSDPFLSPSPTLQSGKEKDASCPVLRPRFGFLQTADLFDVQAITHPSRKRVRVGLSAPYAAFDRCACDLLLRILRDVPSCELLLESNSLGGEKAAAALLSTLEQDLPHSQHRCLKVLSEKASLTDFLRASDIFLDITRPRSAYMLWQSLRHAVPALTLRGATIPERLGFSVVAQMGVQELCACEDEEQVVERLRHFATNAVYRRRFCFELQRNATRLKDRKQLTRKALAVVEVLFEGVVNFGRADRYRSANEGLR